MIVVTYRRRILLESDIYPEKIVGYQDRPIQRTDSIDSAGICRLSQRDSRIDDLVRSFGVLVAKLLQQRDAGLHCEVGHTVVF